jgi:hypothetical protein
LPSGPLATLPADAEPGLPAGMVITHTVIPGSSGNWQVIVCVANMGSITATDVIADASWATSYHLLALRSRNGPVDYKDTLASARFGDLPPGTQAQVALLLSDNLGQAADHVPGIQTRLAYRSGPPVVSNPGWHCEPEGLQAPLNAVGQVQRSQNSPRQPLDIIQAPQAQPVFVPLRTPLPPSITDLINDPWMGQVAATSWLCLLTPLLLLLGGIVAMIYALRRRVREFRLREFQPLMGGMSGGMRESSS